VDANFDANLDDIDEVSLVDQGSPVYYVESRDIVGKPTAVRPVCLLNFYRREDVGEDEERCEEATYMYCVSIDKILASNPNLQIIGTPPQQ